MVIHKGEKCIKLDFMLIPSLKISYKAGGVSCESTQSLFITY